MRGLMAAAVFGTALCTAGAASAASQRCLAESAGPGWRVRMTAIYGEAGLQGSGMVIDLSAPAQGLKPGSNHQFNVIVGSADPALGYVRLTSLASADGHVAVEAASPEVFSINASMMAGFDKTAAPGPLKTNMRILLDGKTAFSGPAVVAKPLSDLRTSAVGVDQIKLGDLRAKDYHDAEASDLTMALYGASKVRVETTLEDGSLVGSFDIPRASIDAAMAARANVRAEAERKLKAGECQIMLPPVPKA